MERKEFLKKLGFGTMIVPFLVSCSDSDDPSLSDDDASGGSCSLTPSETEGPYPTKNPSSLEMVDIRSDRNGVLLDVEITVQDKSDGCTPLAGALVDIWHCDADGIYSEYNTAQSLHFLRGRQETDSEGLAKFRTIFPGWYSGRATHIHVHIYSASGNSLLVTQIAFPGDVCDTVHTTATAWYKKGKQDTTNASDDIFRDSISSELADVTGSIAEGYVLKHTIVVA